MFGVVHPSTFDRHTHKHKQIHTILVHNQTIKSICQAFNSTLSSTIHPLRYMTKRHTRTYHICFRSINTLFLICFFVSLLVRNKKTTTITATKSVLTQITKNAKQHLSLKCFLFLSLFVFCFLFILHYIVDSVLAMVKSMIKIDQNTVA